MLDREHIQQSIGEESSGNNQAGRDIINIGLSYTEAKEIFYDLFEKNFYRLSTEAKKIVDQRCKDFIDKFLNQLRSKNPNGLTQANDPDFQYDLVTAQIGYARCGDPELANMLITILIERTKEPERSLSQIVLNESIDVVSKLTKEELDALTALFVVEYHSKSCKFENVPDFANYISTYVLSFWNSIKNEGTVSAHLFYTGCCEHMFIGTVGLNELLKRSYVLSPIDIINLKTSIENENPEIKPFFGNFDMSILNHMFLTSVGIVIGYVNLCRVTGEEFNLSKWL